MVGRFRLNNTEESLDVLPNYILTTRKIAFLLS